MTDNVPGGIAPPPNEEGAEELGSDNLTALDAIRERIEEASKEPEEPEENVAPEVEEEAPDTEEETEDPDSDDQKDEELTNALGDDLTDEESAWVAANPQSRLAKRIGKLVKRAKTAEEELEAARNQEHKQDEDDPLQRTARPGDNAFKDMSTKEELAAKNEEISQFIDWADDLLEENDDALGDDIIYEQGDHEWTKKEIRQRLRMARKHKERDLPDRYRELQNSEQRKEFASKMRETAAKELAWFDDAESEQAVKLKEMVNDPRLKEAVAAVPDLGWQMEYILAHAVNSMSGAGKPAKRKLKAPKQNPLATPQGNAAAPARKTGGALKEFRRLTEIAETTGSIEDAVAARAFQLANKL